MCYWGARPRAHQLMYWLSSPPTGAHTVSGHCGVHDETQIKRSNCSFLVYVTIFARARGTLLKVGVGSPFMRLYPLEALIRPTAPSDTDDVDSRVAVTALLPCRLYPWYVRMSRVY